MNRNRLFDSKTVRGAAHSGKVPGGASPCCRKALCLGIGKVIEVWPLWETPRVDGILFVFLRSADSVACSPGFWGPCPGWVGVLAILLLDMWALLL